MICQAQSAWAQDYVPGALYVKFQPSASKKTSAGISADEALSKFGTYNIKPAFRVNGNLGSKKISPKTHDLLESVAAIKLVRLPPNLDMEYVAKKLSAHPDIEYAEPVYIARVCGVPNDPDYGLQEDHFNLINAAVAWDIAQGDSSVVIAIVDTGTDWRHPDLIGNVWTNPGEKEEPDNGDDDDGNGYDDDVHGWDFYAGEYPSENIIEDNNPIPEIESHGTHVAGIAAAVTDNGTGIASLSHNVRFMPLKAGPGDGEGIIVAGYQAILYAAENGADIINCSWGSSFYSRTAETVIETATSRGALIVGSAGNSNLESVFYPAGYPNVLAVGSVDNDGEKSGFSNYGAFVDISAPGDTVYSTLLDSLYGKSSGTSMAAPFVSALAALIKSANEDWDADKIQAQILGTASPIVADNPYNYLCGCGYIDAEKALGNEVLHIDVQYFEFTDKNGNNNGLFTPGETIEASITIKNLGDYVDNLSFEITSITGFTLPEQSTINVGALNHAEPKTISDILFTVAGNVDYNARDHIRLDFNSTDNSAGFSILDVIVNPSYDTFTANKIEISVDGEGHIGYTDYPDNIHGSGFILRDNSLSESDFFDVPLLFEGGFIIGNNESRISDSVRGSAQLVQENDFTFIPPIQFERANGDSMQKGTFVFSDEGADNDSYNIIVTSEAYEYGEPGHDQYIIIAYSIKNDGNEILPGLRAGMFLDFDIPESSPSDDFAFYSKEDDILIMAEDESETEDKLMIGATVSGSIYTPWIIKNEGIDDFFFGIYNGFTEAEKWRSLSAGKKTEITELGPADLSMVLSPESFTLEPGKQKQVTFIIAYGLGYDDLRSQIINGRTRAEQIVVAVEDERFINHPEQFSITSVYPNPFNPGTTISFYLPEPVNITLNVYDILGRHVQTVFRGFKTSGEHALVFNGERLASGIYFISLETERGFKTFRKITVLK